MADLVVIDGQQYPAGKLPDGVDASGAVPLNEWRKAQAKTPAPAAAAPKKKRARKAVSDDNE